MNGPPLYDVWSSRPAGSPRVLSRRPSCLAVALRSAANPSRLPPTVVAIAYAASFADTIIIDAIICSNGHGFPTGSPMRMVSTDASCALAVTFAPGQSRSTAVSAVMIFAVLAGWTAVCTESPMRTLPVAASTTMSALGDDSAAAVPTEPGTRGVTVATLIVAAITAAAPTDAAKRRRRRRMRVRLGGTGSEIAARASAPARSPAGSESRSAAVPGRKRLGSWRADVPPWESWPTPPLASPPVSPPSRNRRRSPSTPKRRR